MSISIILLYILLPVVLLVGAMYFIRRKREEKLERDTDKISDIKAEEVDKIK